MTTTQTTVRLGKATLAQLEWLRQQGHGTQSAVIRTAVDRFYHTEIERWENQQRGETTMNEQQKKLTAAQARVRNNKQLLNHEQTIFSDWPNWDEHIDWILKAPVHEIVSWAETVEQQ